LVSPRGAAAPAGSIPWTPRAATALTGAVTTAIELNHNYVGTEHLLLALMREPEVLAARILAAHKVDPKDAPLRVIDLTKEVAG
jgi:ATP-dependent Clp protease ATP-binding subunit ClpC